MAEKVEGIGAKAYLPRFATCRDIRHRWDYIEWIGNKRTLICTRCGTIRKDVLDAFDVTHRSYIYPKGYSWQHEPIPVKTLRRELRRQAQQLVNKTPVAKRALQLVKGGKDARR